MRQSVERLFQINIVIIVLLEILLSKEKNMLDYNLSMSMAFIIFGIFFLLMGKGNISHGGLGFLAVLMPIAGYFGGLSVSEILTHVAIAFGGVIVGFLYFMFVVQRGGLIKSFMVIVLWLPIDYLIPVIVTLLITGFVMGLIDTLVMKLLSTDRQFLTKHYTAILMVIAGVIVSPLLNIPIIY